MRVNKMIIAVFSIAMLMACKKEGCTDQAADNYNSNAKNDDGSCVYTNTNPGGGGAGDTGNENLPIRLTGTESVERTISDISTNANVVEYYVDGNWKIDAPITIAPGVRIEMRPGGRIEITANGSLDATGTANNKINIAGAESEAGHWGYIHIKSNNLNNKLIHCNISDGSGGTFIYGMITLKGNAQLKMQNSSITNGSEHGLHLDAGNSKLPGFESNFFDHFDKSPLVLGGLYQTKFLDASTTFGNNIAVNKIYVNGADVSSNVTIPKVMLPYFLNKNSGIDGGHTDVDAGVELIMGPGVRIDVKVLGSLAFNGTSSNRITVRGDQPAEGYWQSIIINSNDFNNDFSYTDFSDAGGHWQTPATIYLRGDGRLQMDNCKITNGSEEALNGSNSSSYTDGGGNEQSGNAGGGLLP